VADQPPTEVVSGIPKPMGRTIVQVSCPKCHHLVDAEVIDAVGGPIYYATFPVVDPHVKIETLRRRVPGRRRFRMGFQLKQVAAPPADGDQPWGCFRCGTRDEIPSSALIEAIGRYRHSGRWQTIVGQGRPGV
jgi:hypothetical protein